MLLTGSNCILLIGLKKGHRKCFEQVTNKFILSKKAGHKNGFQQ